MSRNLTPWTGMPRLLIAGAAALAFFVTPACVPSDAELMAAFAKRGWVYDGAPRNGSTFSARGTVQGHPFTIEGKGARGKSAGAMTTVSIDTDTGSSRVIVAHAVPDFLKLDGQLAGMLLPNFPVPPRWTDAPEALKGTWDVYATPADGARWITPPFVEALPKLPQGDHPPYVIIGDGTIRLAASGMVWTEAELVTLIEAAAAAGR